MSSMQYYINAAISLVNVRKDSLYYYLSIKINTLTCLIDKKRKLMHHCMIYVALTDLAVIMLRMVGRKHTVIKQVFTA